MGGNSIENYKNTHQFGYLKNSDNFSFDRQTDIVVHREVTLPTNFRQMDNRRFGCEKTDFLADL